MYLRNHPGATEKLCRRCRVIKPVEQFPLRRQSRDGRHSYCKPCNRAVVREWLYGLTEEDFNRMVEEQNGLCAICGVAPPDVLRPDNKKAKSHMMFGLHVDHDHDREIVRALLCKPCNTMIGIVKEDPVVLEKAAAYLRSHGRG